MAPPATLLNEPRVRDGGEAADIESFGPLAADAVAEAVPLVAFLVSLAITSSKGEQRVGKT